MKKTFFHGDKTVADDEDVTKNLNLYFHTAVNSVGINKNKSSDRDRKFGWSSWISKNRIRKTPNCSFSNGNINVINEPFQFSEVTSDQKFWK